MLNRDANFSLNQMIMSVRMSNVKKQQAMMVDYPPLCCPHILSCAVIGSN